MKIVLLVQQESTKTQQAMMLARTVQLVIHHWKLARLRVKTVSFPWSGKLLVHSIYPKYRDILTYCLTSLRIWTGTFHFLASWYVLKCWMSGKQCRPDQMLHYAASDLGQHYLPMPVCTNLGLLRYHKISRQFMIYDMFLKEYGLILLGNHLHRSKVGLCYIDMKSIFELSIGIFQH